jgi:hypothetical protein|tara:strand:+ start:540 stop:734 length:195 start_codon:yes stop_codon:yes gene_type:complete
MKTAETIIKEILTAGEGGDHEAVYALMKDFTRLTADEQLAACDTPGLQQYIAASIKALPGKLLA